MIKIIADTVDELASIKTIIDTGIINLQKRTIEFEDLNVDVDTSFALASGNTIIAIGDEYSDPIIVGETLPDGTHKYRKWYDEFRANMQNNEGGKNGEG